MGKNLRQEPSLEGPDGVCLNGAFVYATFSAGGVPATDRYIWSITDQSGFEIFYQSGVADVSEITFPFTSTGNFNVELRVVRGDDQDFYRESKAVLVERGPSFVLPPDVVFCANEPVTLQALDPNDANFGSYTIEWLNPANTVLGTGNTIIVSEPGRYYAKASSLACEAVASTFVGPSIEVEVVGSSSTVCLGGTVTYTPDVPILAEWSYQKNGQAGRISLGRSFELDLGTGDLDGLGDYQIFFTAEDPDYPDCNVEESFDLRVRKAPEFTLVKVQDAESCTITDGAFEIQADSDLESLTISGAAPVNFNQLAEGEVRTISGLDPMLYTVTATFGTCSLTKTINIGNKNPEDGINYEVRSTPQVCTTDGTLPGTLTLDFLGLMISGKYRIIHESGQVYGSNFMDETAITVELPKGSYQIEVSDGDDCSSTSGAVFQVEGSNLVDFSVPSDLTVCRSFDLVPASTQDLSYTLTAPDGEVFNANAGIPFEINQSGSYQLTGRPTDPDSPLCPRMQDFEVTVNEPLEYNFSKRIIDCFGNQIYSLELFGRDPNTVIIRWLTENEVIVGRDLEFFPPSTGNYLLEVQPRASSSCPVQPLPFEVSIPANNAEVSLEGAPFCGNNPFSVLTATAESELVHKMEWYKIEENGDKIWLFEWDDENAVEVTETGIYEVVIRNEINCQLGSASYEVLEFESTPVDLQSEYFLCSADNISPTINPGEFEKYSWYKEGDLFSEDMTFRPSSPGLYELRVTDVNGCEQINNFEVIEECEVLIRYPNAIVLGDPQNDFKLYADPDIETIEVFIFNRNGELVYHCQSENQGGQGPVCSWDGLLNGSKTIPGTYPIVIKYKSEVIGVDKVEKKSILIIDN